MKQINCAQFDKVKEAYVDGTLAPVESAAVEAHVAGCDHCRERLGLTRNLAAGMGGLVKATLVPPSVEAQRAQAGYAQVIGRAAAVLSPAATRSSFAVGTLGLLVVLVVVGVA